VTPIDLQARALLERWNAQPGVPVEALTAGAVRQDDLAVLELQAAPDALHSVEELELPTPVGVRTARLYRPRPGQLPTLLYLHGGGFVIGPEGYDAPLRQLALASNRLIVALHYRLAPEHRFPAAMEDAVAGARWLAREAQAIGGLNVPSEFIVGNVFEHDDIAARLDRYRLHDRAAVAQDPVCGSCALAGSCGRGCPAAVIAAGRRLGERDREQCPVPDTSSTRRGRVPGPRRQRALQARRAGRRHPAARGAQA
jgi:radical SAM protein with 4Fe4S-binding SPASM domain